MNKKIKLSKKPKIIENIKKNKVLIVIVVLCLVLDILFFFTGGFPPTQSINHSMGGGSCDIIIECVGEYGISIPNVVVLILMITSLVAIFSVYRRNKKIMIFGIILILFILCTFPVYVTDNSCYYYGESLLELLLGEKFFYLFE